MLLLPLLGRKISISEYGVFALLFPLIQNLLPTASFGLGTSLMRYYFDKKIPRERILFSVFLAWLFSTCIWYPILFVIFYFTPLYNFQLSEYKLGYFIPPFLISLLCFGFAQIVTESFRAKQHAIAFVSSNTCSRLVIVVVLAIAVSMGYISSLQLIWGVALATLLVFIYSLFFYLPGLTYSLDKPLIKELMHFGYPVMLTPISTLLLFLGNRYVLLIFSSTEEVGLYSMAISLVQIVALIPAAFGRWWVPELFSRLRDKRTEEVFFKNTVHLYLIVYVFFSLSLQFSAKFLLTLVGNAKYLSALSLFPILISGFLFEAYYTLNVDRLYYAKRVSYVFALNLFSGVINIFLSFILVKFFGMLGAAISFSLSMMLQAIIVMIFSKKIDEIKFPLVSMSIYIILGCIGLFLISYLLYYDKALYAYIPMLGILAFLLKDRVGRAFPTMGHQEPIIKKDMLSFDGEKKRERIC